MGLDPVEKKLFPNEQPLAISNIGHRRVFDSYQDNQTMVKHSQGYYYKKNIGLFQFISGNEIKVFVDSQIVNADFVRTLLNYPIACAFYQRQIMSLHASAVIYKGKVIIFPGSSLSGKSTIAAYLLKNGGKLITEDTAVIEIHDGKAFVRSSYPFIKLSKFANDTLSFSLSDGIKLPTEKNARMGHLLDENSFSAVLAPIDYCFFLEYDDHEYIKPMKPSEALSKILACSLNIYPLTETKLRELFHWSANLSRRFKIFQFRRRKGILFSQFLADFIAESSV